MPEPADCVSVAELKVVAVTLLALTIVTSPSGVAPTTPVKVMSPVPAVRVRSSAAAPAVVASSVLWNVMFAPVPAVVVSIATVVPAPLSMTARRKSTVSEVVLMVRAPVRVTVPAPFCVTVPVVEMSAARSRVPPLVSVSVPVPVVVRPVVVPSRVPLPSMSVERPAALTVSALAPSR